LLRQRKKAKKGDAAAVARCAGPQVQHASVGGTNKLAFGSDRFAPLIRPTRTGLGNVTCGQVKISNNPNIHSLDYLLSFELTRDNAVVVDLVVK